MDLLTHHHTTKVRGDKLYGPINHSTQLNQSITTNSLILVNPCNWLATCIYSYSLPLVPTRMVQKWYKWLGLIDSNIVHYNEQFKEPC